MSKRRERLLTACCLAVGVACVAFTLAVRRTAQTLYVCNPQLESVPGVRLMDPNLGLFEIVPAGPNQPAVKWKNVGIHRPELCRLRQCGRKGVKVIGLVNSTEEYRIVLDTGCPHNVMVTDTVVRRSNLEIHPFPSLGPHQGGFCHLCRLSIGELTIVHPETVYLSGHYERKVLGITAWREQEILLGLSVLKHFSYVLVDGPQREVVLAGQSAFVPGDPNRWSSYPMTVEKHASRGYELLAASIPLAGQTHSLRFDTGAGPGLIVSQDRWKAIGPNLRITSRRRARLARPFGFEPCDVITVQNLDIAGMCLPEAKVRITESDDRLTLGMGFFTKTVVVLDFKNNLLWIQNRGEPSGPSMHN